MTSTNHKHTITFTNRVTPFIDDTHNNPRTPTSSPPLQLKSLVQEWASSPLRFK